MQSLKSEHGQPLRSLEVLALAEEPFPVCERLGSKNFCIREDVNDIADGEGINFKAAMNNAGLITTVKITIIVILSHLLKVHIEQGKVLETEKKAIGVVNGIVGQKRYTINLKGRNQEQRRWD